MVTGKDLILFWETMEEKQEGVLMIALITRLERGMGSLYIRVILGKGAAESNCRAVRSMMTPCHLTA